jgi:hypothetical protein
MTVASLVEWDDESCRLCQKTSYFVFALLLASGRQSCPKLVFGPIQRQLPDRQRLQVVVTHQALLESEMRQNYPRSHSSATV